MEQKGRELKGWKNVFQLSCCSEERGFVPRFHVYKHTYNVQDGRNTPSLVAGEMTHLSVTLSIKLFISFRNKLFSVSFYACHMERA